MERPALYVTAVPIGCREDITLRALEVLREADFVVCEESKPGSKLLKSYDISKPLELLNEHNEKQQAETIADRLLAENLCAALITDAGTPAFADPGARLVRYCHGRGIRVVPVPGASSLMAAWSVSGISAGRFVYYGFLPPQQEKRKESLKEFTRWLNWDVILLETPYRLQQLLRDMNGILGGYREIVLAYSLTLPSEEIFTGTLAEACRQAASFPKAPFVVILKRDVPRRRK
jgi:16S rRNA (cytidine1402-2'-O)-methyltransferase